MKKIISQELIKAKRYLPHTLTTKIHAVRTYMNQKDIGYVCRKYHISRTSLWRWMKKYNGTIESLIDKSHKPKTKHPMGHTNTEIRWIRNYVKRNPKITLNELWYKLRKEKGYTREATSLYRVMRKLGIKFNKGKEIKNTSKKKHDKEYDTPKELGIKWQIDVKYVPNICKVNLDKDRKYYQYTCIDEASRERFLEWYQEITPENTVTFIKNSLKYFGYKPQIIQTDNGTEFSYNNAKIKKKHPMDVLLDELKIIHYKIRPRTPQHNGKVERSHRNDNERFYSYLKFYDFEDLKKQGKAYLKRSNNIPMKVLGYLTPLEKRVELESLMK